MLQPSIEQICVMQNIKVNNNIFNLFSAIWFLYFIKLIYKTFATLPNCMSFSRKCQCQFSSLAISEDRRSRFSASLFSISSCALLLSCSVAVSLESSHQYHRAASLWPTHRGSTGPAEHLLRTSPSKYGRR